MIKNIFLLSIEFIISSSILSAQTTADTASNSFTGQVIVDSNLDAVEVLSGINIPSALKQQLELINVHYYSFDGRVHRGQLVVNKIAAQDLVEIFEFIFQTKFPVEKVVPISRYEWSDEKSMNDNNTACFNYRFISGTRILSKHANGLAIDINPKFNPYIKNDQQVPENSSYNINIPGTITAGSQLVSEFKKRGWVWGGDWKSLKDYQHFQKNSE